MSNYYFHANSWIGDLLFETPDRDLAGFFWQFSRQYRGYSTTNGIFLSQQEMAAELGVSLTYFKKQMAKLIQMGIVSYSRLSSHPRGGCVYFINIDEPGQYDAKATSMQFKNSKKTPPKKLAERKIKVIPLPAVEKVSTVVELQDSLASKYSTIFPSQKVFAEGLIREALQEGNSIKTVVNGLYEIKAKGFTLSRIGFEYSLKEISTHIPLDVQAQVNKDLNSMMDLVHIESKRNQEIKVESEKTGQKVALQKEQERLDARLAAKAAQVKPVVSSELVSMAAEINWEG